MNELLNKIAVCVERGKVNIKSPYPPDLKGQEGVDELTKAALDAGISAQDLLEQGLIEGMKAIGARFRRDEVFVPDVLMAAKAMKAGLGRATLQWVQSVAQLAQFSTVQGISDLNTTVNGFTASLTGDQVLKGASLVGHSVVVPSESLALPASGKYLIQVYQMRASARRGEQVPHTLAVSIQ